MCWRRDLKAPWIYVTPLFKVTQQRVFPDSANLTSSPSDLNKSYLGKVSLMLGSLKWTMTRRWRPVLQHPRLVLISCYVIHRSLAWPCNTLWSILDPEHRFEFQQLKSMLWTPASHLPGAGDVGCAFTAPQHNLSPAVGLCLSGCAYVICQPLISLLYNHKGGEWQRCCLAITRVVLQSTLWASPLLRDHQEPWPYAPAMSGVYLPWHPVQCYLTEHTRWFSRQMCYSISLRVWLCADMRKLSS